MDDKAEGGFKPALAPLIEHLTELRSRLIYCVIALVIAIIVCYIFAADIYGILTKPLVDAMEERGQNANLIYTALQEAFFTYLKLAGWGGIFLSFPIIAIQLWKFIAPGLYQHEQKAFLPFLLATPVLFFLGASLVYFLIMPNAISFFLDFQSPDQGMPDSGQIQFLGKVDQYLSLVMTFILAFGVCFQLPVILTLLGRVGIISCKDLEEKRKYAVVGIALMAAILTPPDPISQVGLAIPVYILYEISILMVRIVERKRAERLAEAGLNDHDVE